MSLARKISLLFGAAVLLTIAATLTFPWLQMSALDEQAILTSAKRVATAAYQAVDLHQPDWSRMQLELERRWPLLVDELDLPAEPPKLVSILPARVLRGFQRDAIARLRRYAEQQYYWQLQEPGRIVRLAMAIRGTDTDPHPSALRGIIDVRLPAPQATGVWNTVVTVLAGASGAVLAMLVFYLISQRLVLSPVRALRQVAEQVTTGDIEVRSKIQTGDEFQKLSEDFNNMLTHLKAAQEELRKTNRSLDIRLGELAETNVALYESNRLKSEFLANVTHELRTPLVSIIGFAELLRDALQNPETDRRRLTRCTENILTSGRSLLEIINDLLDLAKIEAGKMELHCCEFSIAELCQDLIDFVRPLADKRDQQLRLHLASTLPRFHTDSGKLKQILYNLLSNAVKFTPTGGSICLAVERDGGHAARLIVRDNGPGIPPAKHETIFESFRQLDPSKTREHEGTGLGLAITRELVQMLGGTIRVESEPGHGATFIVELPAVTTKNVSKPTIRLTR